MRRVLITCPEEETPADTGLRMPADEFDRAKFHHVSTPCAECEELHTWGKGDAFLGDPE